MAKGERRLRGILFTDFVGCAALLAATALLACAGLGLGDASSGLERRVVRILTHAQRGDWAAPWSVSAPEQRSGSGFVIAGGLVMTNAHVVSDARLILLYLDGDPTPHEARVHTVGHDCDLALVEPLKPGLLDAIPPFALGPLPALRSVVETYGYPAGGERISSTRGVVSRIEMQRYSHTEGDSHLSVQTDAAINPGNSGGPVVQDGRVVGVAFQAAGELENVGYFIPREVIDHFLADAADGRYDGYADLGIRVANLENPAARRAARMRDGESGVRVDQVFPGSSADGHLRSGDVLLAVEGLEIANDGTIAVDGLRLHFEVLLDRLQVGEEIWLRRLRHGERRDLRFAIDRYPPYRLYRRIYDELPRYYVYAGLVFVPLDREVLMTLGDDLSTDLVFESYLRPIVEPERLRREPVVLLGRLDHAVNADLALSRSVVVERVNGRSVGSLVELVAAVEESRDPFQLFEFAHLGGLAVLDRAEAERAQREILELYGIQSDRRL
jgi:S1-C subfamily serine protease